MSAFLLDTNVISEVIRPRPNPKVVAWLDSVDQALLYISVLSLGEIRKGIAMLPDAARRTRLEAWLAHDLELWFSGRVLAVDAAIADRWGRISAPAKSDGRPLPIIDALLAATALHHNLIFVTRNAKDVARTGVAVFDPWSA